MQKSTSPLQDTAVNLVAKPLAAYTETASVVADFQFGIEMHRKLLMCMCFCPIPTIVAETCGQGGTMPLWFGNAAARSMTGTDQAGLQQLDVASLTCSRGSAAMQLLERGLASGIEVYASLPPEDAPDAQRCYVVALPISGLGDSSAVLAHMFLFLQPPGAHALCQHKLAQMVSLRDLEAANFEVDTAKYSSKMLRRSLFGSNRRPAASSASSHEAVKQSMQALFQSIAEQQAKPSAALPSALDPVGWLELFEILLTQSM